MHRLPAELLIQILLWANYLNCAHWCRFTDFRAVAVAVCKLWRDVIYSTPTFWTYLAITRATKPEFVRHALQHAPSTAANVFLTLHHIWELPPRAFLYLPHHVQSVSEETFLRDALGELLAQLHRVERIVIKCPSPETWLRVIDRFNAADTSTVSRLCVTVSRQAHIHPTRCRRDSAVGFASPRCITHLSLTAVPTLWAPTSDFRHLTKLHLAQYWITMDVRWRHLVDLLTQCVRLENLHMDEVECLAVPLSLCVTLPAVKTVTFAYKCHTSVSVFALIDTPAIDSFHLVVRSSLSTFLHDHPRHLDKVRQLRLESELHSSWPQDLDLLLQIFPSVTGLDLRKADDVLVQRLMCHFYAATIHLPNLRYLQIGLVLTELDVRCVLAQARLGHVASDFTLVTRETSNPPETWTYWSAHGADFPS